jgi:hypothetical protein
MQSTEPNYQVVSWQPQGSGRCPTFHISPCFSDPNLVQRWFSVALVVV